MEYHQNEKKFKCYWHDFDCDQELPYCRNCNNQPNPEEKLNGKAEPKVVKDYEWGMPMCPSCGEPTYDNERCMFCGQIIITSDSESE